MSIIYDGELPGMWETADLIDGETDMYKFSNPNDPYDPSCNTFARDMDYIDFYKEPDETRVDFIMRNEGTYNSFNGHFLCDECYIEAGMPTAPNGWVCP